MSRYVDEYRGRFGVEPICRTLDVSASAYYKRASGRRSSRAVEDERLLARIRELHTSNYRHFTQSKMMCAVALDRACELAERGLLPSKGLGRWQHEQARIREFVETRCYSYAKASYVRSAGEEELDASLLLAVLAGYDEPASPRLIGTVDAVRRELGRGPLVYRWGDEPGAFLTCSFWLADAYARQGRLAQAATLMDELVALANDLGLYAEELHSETGEFLGNFPQGLTHLALINAAVSCRRAQEPER